MNIKSLHHQNHTRPKEVVTTEEVVRDHHTVQETTQIAHQIDQKTARKTVQEIAPKTIRENVQENVHGIAAESIQKNVINMIKSHHTKAEKRKNPNDHHHPIATVRRQVQIH